MKYTNLDKNPEYFLDTIKLIEKAFNYDSHNSFLCDFYPLMNKSNHKNCFLIIENNQVIAHIGVLEKVICLDNQDFNIALYGGIAVSEEHQGKGYFRDLFQYVLNIFKDKILHLLWSEKIDIYEKFLFYPAFPQYQLNHDLSDAVEFLPCKLNELSPNDINQLNNIYNQASEIRCKRTLQDWEILTHITSTDLYIKRNGELINNYFFLNKGQDLQGIIHEIGNFQDTSEICKYGILWSPYFNTDTSQAQYAANVKIGSHSHFIKFISAYTQNKILINKIDDDFVNFTFESKNYELEHSDFLAGIFGPGQFGELNNCRPIYISGLDSI